MSNEKITLTYTEYLEAIKGSYLSLAKHDIFGIEDEYIEMAFSTWIEEHSMEKYYTYIQCILTLPPTQHMINVDWYLFNDARSIFVSMVSTLIEIGYYQKNNKVDQEEVDYIIDTMQEVFEKVTPDVIKLDNLREEYQRRSKYEQKLNDDS